jgi:PAS domain S-box-containing protein
MKLRRRLQKIAEAILELGWRRVVIRAVRSGTMDLESLEDLVTAGLTSKEKEFLWKHKTSGEIWRERFGSGFERFKIGEFYHLPWSDPWVRRKFSRSTVPSKLAPEEMVDWDPQDLLYAPLKLADGRVVGILSIDDPLDGRRPTRESLTPLELFIHQAAVAIQSAQLYEQLERAKDQVREYAKRLEEKVKERTLDLRRNEEKLRSIITASPDAITVSDLSGNIIDCNQAALEAFRGKSRQDLVGKNALELIAKKDRQRAMENMKKTLEQGSIRNIEYAFLTKNGFVYPAELSASLVRDASGNPVGFVAITSDITERKRMEQQVLRSERLAAMGEVAAMVGHDLRNPLTGIAGATYYLKMKMKSRGDSRKKREMLELIEKDIDYSNKIVNDLLDYSREIHLDLTETSPRSIVEETLSMVEAPDNVAIFNLAHNMPNLSLDMEKIKRVFLNIVKNAVDAMPKGGRLTIKGRKSGANFEFSFEDTGVGMAQHMVEKIFSPLFTTKAKGMGFGLAICKRIVEAHHGKISVETAIGKGTTFIVTVPLKPEVEGGERVWMNVPESLLSTTMKA